jgi:DNA-binding FadR family transcriptional regulator
VDKRAVLRAKRESMVLELSQGAKGAASPASAGAAAQKLDEVKIRELKTAAERALDNDAVTARERAFVKRFFEVLEGR